ncbi:MlaC/ttg2D family ABC transporter substrate-binding protein [Desulfotignum phosphitoxidans]|uniref:MlaC/ttg2D family ABC transporter substrate-binding protein n=1 Tax=Desulfotignum phosphitoxidans TaxID=190898 RepID=UPI001F159578|nr:ABC transporter substrate-binding protein [Desulfotignum phosphitoxidans]
MAPVPGYAQDISPRTQLEAGIDAILAVLKDDAFKGEANTARRREALRKKIYERFDLEKMSQFSLGRHWRGRTDEERQTFVELFSRLLEETYVGKIESYTDEQVEFVKEQVRDDKAQIDTNIITDSIEIPIDYRMYRTEAGQWMVYDIVVEGVSLVANYRSQFARMLESDSFESMIQELEKKTASNG